MSPNAPKPEHPKTAVYLAVVVPAYNEKERILRTLQRLDEYYSGQSYTWSVLVVSDGSMDGTDGVVADFCKTRPLFSLDSYKPNRGKGHAVRRGMLKANGEIILFCDADLATPQEETAKLLPFIEAGSDIAIGSRPLRESNLTKRQPWYREMLGRVANKVIQVLAIRGIRDTQCGFKMFRRDAARDIFARCKMDGFSFDFEALMIARDLGYTIAEVPIQWAHQEGSKVVLWRDLPKSFYDLIKLRLLGKGRRLRKREAEAS
ncbi:MAG: dolichyl-phosphate beta-glucosyltransferase [Fimbriimonadaceae bacterium]